MRLSGVPLAISLLLVAACEGAPDVGRPHDAGAVGALALHLADLGPGTERAVFEITGPGMAPLTGVVDVKDGVIDATITGVPAGADREIAVELVGGGETLCACAASAISIDPGRSSQVVLVPGCEAPRVVIDKKKKKNKVPEITAVFASRTLAELRERVALSVAVSDQDGDPLTVLWTEGVPGFGFDDPTAPATGWTAGPSGATNTLTVTVDDGRGGVASASIVVEVQPGVVGPATCDEPSPIALGQRIRGLTLGGASVLQPAADCGGGVRPPPPPPPGGPSIDAGAGEPGPTDPATVPSEAPERVFQLVLTETQTFSVSTSGSAFNATVSVHAGDCGAGDALGCTQTFAFPPGLTFEDAAPGTYYLVVDGASRFDRGEFSLQVRAGGLPEDCQNGNDDDGDGAFDCADEDCAGEPGCLECAFDCNPDPTDCFDGACDRFSGRCFAFPEFGTACEGDGDPATAEICFDGLCQPDTAVCGNGVVEPGEACDDGNTTPEDGCEPTCDPTTCGGNVCDDGNPCTADTCTDPATSTCTFEPAADDTACEADGDPATPDTCQAGLCVGQPPPPPDAALMILDPAVLEDPAFSLAAMHDRLALDGDGAALFEQWASTLTTNLVLNLDVAVGRPGFASFVASLPRVAGKIDLAAAGFRASAFVNRIDLKKAGTCGESRVVYTKETGVFDGSDRMTLIFEFGVPDDGTNCLTATQRWVALRGLEGEALRAAAVQLMLDNSQRHLLNQFRTNDFIQAPFWELREFHLDLATGAFEPFPVADTPPFAMQDDPAFRQFVISNATRFNSGAREGNIMPVEMLGAASNAGGQRFEFGTLIPSMPGLTANFNIMTCSGCHLTETGTSFVHVSERTAGQPSNLSLFLRSELEFRATVLDGVLATTPPTPLAP